MSKFIVEVTGVDSIETQGYAPVRETLTFDYRPSVDEVIIAVNKIFYGVRSADFEVVEEDA